MQAAIARSSLPRHYSALIKPDSAIQFDKDAKTMIKTKAFSETSGVDAVSDIESLHYVDGTVVVVIACSIDQTQCVHGMKVTFVRPTGFRLLDELELARYWISPGFSPGSHVLEVEDDGWSAEESRLQTFDTARREWLVVSGNACVNVFCPDAPQIERISWQYKV